MRVKVDIGVFCQDSVLTDKPKVPRKGRQIIASFMEVIMFEIVW